MTGNPNGVGDALDALLSHAPWILLVATLGALAARAALRAQTPGPGTGARMETAPG